MAEKTQIIRRRKGSHGLYSSVNLNGWTLVSEEAPPDHAAVLLGYRVPHLPEIWECVGYRDGKRYWLGPRGLDPHYAELLAECVVIWKPFEKPFCFDIGRPEKSEYLQWQKILSPTQREQKRFDGLAEFFRHG